MKKIAVIVAGGAGTRVRTSIPKQFILIKDRPVLWYTLETFLNSFEDLEIILVLPANYLKNGSEIIQSTSSPSRIQITEGGATRFHSVKNGLALIQHPSIVFVHDGVRCLVSPDLIHRCFFAAEEFGNAVPAVPASDSIRLETPEGNRQVDRKQVMIIQTPQTFDSETLRKAFEQEYDENFTDEASVVEKLGMKIKLVEGERSNIKITQPIDLIIAEKLLEERAAKTN